MLGCSGTTKSPLDAASDGTMPDVAVPDAGAPVCSCCTQLPFIAAQAGDVAGDGTSVYVTYTTATSTQLQLGITSGDGAAPTAIAQAESFTLASSDNALFYAAKAASVYEVHQRVGTTDSVLGSVTSATGIQLAGNATDVYVSGNETAGNATLWRFSRSSPGTPAVVATASGTSAYLALGSTVAVWVTGTTSWSVALPGPSSPSALSQYAGGLVFVGDVGVVMHGHLLTSHASQYSFEEVLPTAMTLFTSSVIINGGLDQLLGDPNHLYWRVTSGSEATPSQHDVSLSAGTLSGPLASLCTGWPSDVLRQDATHLFGLQRLAGDQWAVDMLAKP